MPTGKKIAGVSLIVVVIGTLAGWLHVNDVAVGSQPQWDPPQYFSVTVNQMTFSVNVRREASHPPVFLLHGFPEPVVMWDRLIDALIAQGFMRSHRIREVIALALDL